MSRPRPYLEKKALRNALFSKKSEEEEIRSRRKTDMSGDSDDTDSDDPLSRSAASSNNLNSADDGNYSDVPAYSEDEFDFDEKMVDPSDGVDSGDMETIGEDNGNEPEDIRYTIEGLYYSNGAFDGEQPIARTENTHKRAQRIAKQRELSESGDKLIRAIAEGRLSKEDNNENSADQTDEYPVVRTGDEILSSFDEITEEYSRKKDDESYLYDPEKVKNFWEEVFQEETVEDSENKHRRSERVLKQREVPESGDKLVRAIAEGRLQTVEEDPQENSEANEYEQESVSDNEPFDAEKTLD